MEKVGRVLGRIRGCFQPEDNRFQPEDGDTTKVGVGLLFKISSLHAEMTVTTFQEDSNMASPVHPSTLLLLRSAGEDLDRHLSSKRYGLKIESDCPRLPRFTCYLPCRDTLYAELRSQFSVRNLSRRILDCVEIKKYSDVRQLNPRKVVGLSY